MQSISVALAKDRLPYYLHLAEQGEVIEITRHGKSVAVITRSTGKAPESEPSGFEMAYMSFRSRLEQDASWSEADWKAYFDIPREIQNGPRHAEDFE